MESAKSAAIVFLPREGESPCVMLEDILFDPAALWLAEGLKAAGVERFLVACHRDDRARAEACFPEDTVFVTTGAENAQEELHTLLKSAGRVMVITEPVFLLSGPVAGGQEPVWSRGFGLLTGEARQRVLDGGDLLAALEGEQTLPEDLAAAEVRREELAGQLAALAKAETARRLQRAGVRLVDPQNTYVSPTVILEPGTTVLPGTILRGSTRAGRGCVLGPNSVLTDVTVGEGSTVNASQCTGCAIGAHTTVGPFAYIRPDTQVGDHVRVGDFVELKNSVIGDETKISHLAYLGDCDVGEGSDIGCGTVTVNYDGVKKFRTRIGAGAFIGCNTNLVAPVSVGDGAYVAAGSTITRDVPSQSLAIARSQQTVKNQWVKKRRGQQDKK